VATARPSSFGSTLHADVRDQETGPERAHEVQDPDGFDLIGVVAQLGLAAVAGDRVADLGVDGDGDQGAVQGVELAFAGEVFEPESLNAIRAGLGEPGRVARGHQATAGRWAARRARCSSRSSSQGVAASQARPR
jgi:hypothetical protein